MQRTSLALTALLGAALLSLMGCGSGTATLPSAKAMRAYFPSLTVGNRWTWRVTESGTTRQETETITGTETIGGATAYRLDQLSATNIKQGTDLLGLSDKRLLQYGFDSYTDAGVLDESIRYPTPWGIDLDIASGAESNQTFTLNSSLGELPVVSTFQIRLRHLGMERVTVPAGTFDAAKLEIRTTLTVALGGMPGTPEVTTYTEWRAEGIGPVKSTSSDGVTEELTSAQVNGSTVP